MSTKLALIKNTQAGAVSQLSNVAIRFVQVPLLLTYLGIDEYGRWLILSTVPSLLMLANPGLGMAAGNEVGMKIAAHKMFEAQKAYSSGMTVMFAFCISLFFLVTSMSAFVPWSTLLKTESGRNIEFAGAAILLVTSVLVALPGDIYVGKFRGAKRSEVPFYYAAVRPWLELAAIIIAILISTNFLSLSIGVLGSSIVLSTIYYLHSNVVLPNIRFSFASADLTACKRVAMAGAGFQGLAIGNAFLVQGPLFIVQWTLGAFAVVTFSTARTLVGSVLQAIGMINSITWSEFSLLLGKGDTSTALRLHRIAFAISISMACAGTVFLSLCGAQIYSMWTGHKLSVSTSLLSIFLAQIPLTALYSASVGVLTATNMHAGISRRYLTGAAASCVCCFGFSIAAGINGAAASLLIVYVFVANYSLQKALNIVGDTPWAFIRGAFHEFSLAISHCLRRVGIKQT